MKHLFDAGVQFFFFDEFAAVELVEANLDLIFKPLVVGEKAGDGFLDQFVGTTAGAAGEVVELGFLGFREMDFHDFRIDENELATDAHG